MYIDTDFISGVHLYIFILKLGIEESIVNVPRITDTDHLFKSNLIFSLFVFLLCRLTSGAFTIDSSTPILRINLSEHPILYFIYKNFRQ
jgi:hypothetical protein